MVGLGVVQAATEAFICSSLGMVLQVFYHFCESVGHTLQSLVDGKRITN